MINRKLNTIEDNDEPTYPVLIFYNDIVQMCGAEEIDYPEGYFEEYLIFSDCYCRAKDGVYIL